MTRLLTALLLTAAPVLAEEPAHVFTIGGLEVLHPWANATQDDHAALYMELHNEGTAPVEIRGARIKDGPEGELVGFRLKDGEMVFDPLPPVPVAPGKSLELAPDGLAILFDGLSEPLVEGAHWEVILRTSAGELEIDVQIEPEGARTHGHAGHAH